MSRIVSARKPVSNRGIRQKVTHRVMLGKEQLTMGSENWCRNYALGFGEGCVVKRIPKKSPAS